MPARKKSKSRSRSRSKSRSPCKSRKSATCRKRDNCTWVKGSAKHKAYCRKGSKSPRKRSPSRSPKRRRSPSPRRRSPTPRHSPMYHGERKMTEAQRRLIAAYRGPGLPSLGVAGTRGLSAGGSACIPLPEQDCRRHSGCEWIKASPTRRAGCRRRAWGAQRAPIAERPMADWVRQQFLAERAARAAPPMNPVAELVAIPNAPPL